MTALFKKLLAPPPPRKHRWIKGFAAFTLAEVLIVLGIIGIIADMTIPTLKKDIDKIVAVTKLKKAYSTLSSATTMLFLDEGYPDSWEIDSLGGGAKANVYLNKMEPYLRMMKKCPQGQYTTKCWADTSVKYLNGGNFANFNNTSDMGSAILADGTLIGFNTPSLTAWSGGTGALSNIWLQNFIDINGASKPNKLGVDIFVFWVTEDGVVPAGSQQETNADLGDTTHGCTNRLTMRGTGCAAWVIYNGNMDYLTCQNPGVGGGECATKMKW